MLLDYFVTDVLGCSRGIFMRLAIVILSSALGGALGQARPTFAKNAIPFTLDCIGARQQPSQRIVAPDRRVVIVVSCRKQTTDDEILLLSVRDTAGRVQRVALELARYWRPRELLWSPNSNAFAVNGAETSYSGFAFMTFDLVRGVAHRLELAQLAQRDMAARLPPCDGPVPAERCKQLEASPEFNMSVMAWAHGSDGLVLRGAVPPSSSYGSIMGKVAGYEIDSQTGRILARLTEAQLNAK
jgi:hypothetical protein